MKKFAIILSCMLACFILFAGCTDQKDRGDQDTNLSTSVEIDDTNLVIDTEGQPDAEDNSANVTLPDGFVYEFKDPDNADGIVVTPRG